MQRIARLVLMGWLLLCVWVAPATAFLTPGASAPDFQLADLNGRQVRLSDFAGRNILLVFGTSWCPACKSQIGTILKAGPLLQEKGVTVLEVYIKTIRTRSRSTSRTSNFPCPFMPCWMTAERKEAIGSWPSPAWSSSIATSILPMTA
jgi:thiol-disulfide isomerase/thioredoxin